MLDHTPTRSQLQAFGLDVQQRTLNGHSWTQLEEAMKHSWCELRITEKPNPEATEISLQDAKLLAPACKLGEEIKLPSVVDRRTWPELVALLVESELENKHNTRHIKTLDAVTFEAQRATVAVQPTPSALRDFELGLLRLLYPEGHGVLYVDVAGDSAKTLWHRLVAEAASTGFRPVILGGAPRELRDGRSAWSSVRALFALQAGSHPNYDPLAVLGALGSVDVAALLAPGGNPSYPDQFIERGTGPVTPSHDESLDALQNGNEVWSIVRIALIPVAEAWQTIAYLPVLLQAGESTPSLAQACAVSREWEQKFGAKVISVRPAMIEWWLDQPPSREAALELAPAHFTFTPEGGSNVLEERASELMGNVWGSWWD
jgi:hypothetical protein